MILVLIIYNVVVVLLAGGLERDDASQLRLFCRSELVFLTLEPYR